MIKRLKIKTIILILFAVAIVALIAINPLKIRTEVCLPADIKTHDKIKDCEVVVQVTPTSYSYITKFKGDSVKFRIVELSVIDRLKGNTKDTIMLLQTVGMKENPELKKGQEYILFLELYKGDIPKTKGAYVGSCAHWSYYIIDNGKIVAVYDELNEITPWLSKKATKESKGFLIQDMKSWIKK